MTSKKTLSSSKLFERIAPVIEAFADESYQCGWNDAIAAMTLAAAKVSPLEGKTPNATRSRAGTQSKPAALKSGSQIEAVHKHIKANQGLSSAELVKAFPHFKEASVRTALKRLNKSKRIENRDGRWY
jgi:hypothetical protein